MKMELGSDNAFPSESVLSQEQGLSKREYAAIKFVAAIIGSSDSGFEDIPVCRTAIYLADTLFEELDKK